LLARIYEIWVVLSCVNFQSLEFGFSVSGFEFVLAFSVWDLNVGDAYLLEVNVKAAYLLPLVSCGSRQFYSENCVGKRTDAQGAS